MVACTLMIEFLVYRWRIHIPILTCIS